MADKLMAASEQESKVLQSQNLIENAKEQIKAKREDEKEQKEIQAANHGLISTSRKPPHVIEGENAKAYVNHVIDKGAEFAETHKMMQDELERQKIKERKAVKEAIDNSPGASSHHLAAKTQSKKAGSDSEESSSESESSDEEDNKKVAHPQVKKAPPPKKAAPKPAPKPVQKLVSKPTTPKPAAKKSAPAKRSESSSSGSSSESDMDEEEAEAAAASRDR